MSDYKNNFLFIFLTSFFLTCNCYVFSNDEIKLEDKNNTKSTKDDFAEAMKAIEKVRNADVKNEILKIDKKIAASRLHKGLRESVSDAVKRLDDDAVNQIKSKINEAESFAKKILSNEPENLEISRDTPDKKNKNVSDALPSPPEINEPKRVGNNDSEKISPKPIPDRVRDYENGENDTIIEAEGRLIFDGSSSLGPDYQVVIFEDNVTVSHPSFVMRSDKLEARFKKSLNGKDSANNQDEVASGRLEIAEATGREVVVTRNITDDQVQVAKAGKVTFKAGSYNNSRESDKIILEIFPSVQKGQSRVIAKSIETRIILVGDEMIVEGPVRTLIVGETLSDFENDQKDNQPDLPKGAKRETIIDADKGAVFNKPNEESHKRQLTFKGNVSVSDPEFNLLSDKLTAIVQPFSKKGLVEKAIAEGDHLKPAQIKHLSQDGKMHLGQAGSITFLGSSGDIIMNEWPEIRRNEHSSIANRRDAQIILKRNGSVSSKGVDTKIVREKEKLEP